MGKRQSGYKPLLFTTTVRNPKRMKGLLKVLSRFDGEKLTNALAMTIVGEIIKYGLYRPMKKTMQIKEKWKGTKKGEFARQLLANTDVKFLLKNNPQDHKEAGFEKGWPSRFATIFDFAKELGFVYYWPGKKIEFSEIGLKLAKSIEIDIDYSWIMVSDTHPEFEQQVFLHALAKYQRNNPFVRVLNDNVPLVLLLEIIKRLNADASFNDCGISKLEIPLIIFWKDSNSDELYELIKNIRKSYGYNPSWEVIVDICVNQIMKGKFKKFKPKSIMAELPDEFIRKMRLTGLISLRGAGRFIDINRNEQKKVDYVLRNYSQYKKYSTEREYFEYMATIDENLIKYKGKILAKSVRDKFLKKWVDIYSWDKIKEEMLILAKKGLSKDSILKYISSPIRLEFLVALAIKTRFPDVKVIPNYPYDDEGLPTSTASGIGDKGDIECYEATKGVLIEVTMAEGRAQTVMEVWPITRHLEEFRKTTKNAMCYFIAPSIFKDSVRQIKYVKKEEGFHITPKTIEEFLSYLGNPKGLYRVS